MASRVAITLVFFLVGALGGRARPAVHAQSDPGGALPPTIILISLDGYRWDYVDRPEAKTLQGFARRGVRAEGLIPVFPSKTFPNHYTIVTGLYPEHHGLVANSMYDPTYDAWYGLSDREAVGDARWYGGEPIWVAAERASQRTAPWYWPGSEAAIAGIRPSYWEPFDFDRTPSELVDHMLGLLDLPPEQRPTFMTIYFHLTDDVGHTYGTESAELDGAIAAVDSALAQLEAGLAARNILDQVDIIVVSDHGMADTNPERVIMLDDAIDLDRVTVSDWNPVVAIWPDSGMEAVVHEQLQTLPHLTVYRRAELPHRLHYRGNVRVAPLIGVADEGWSITTRQYAADHPGGFDGATHGYDPALRSMQGVFIAAGPSFRSGVRLDPVANIHLYELMCAILGLTPAPNDGSIDALAWVLTPGVLAPAE